MARLILKCPYLAPASRADRGGYAVYIATRDGVEIIPGEKRVLPSSHNQRNFISELLKDFPDAKDSFEYEDYIANPTVGNASEFITRTLEDHYTGAQGREGYARYIAERPRVARVGNHGMFGSEDGPVVLSQVAKEIRQHPGNIWTPILSLRREDADRLGYDKAANWQALLRAHAQTFADNLKIPLDDLVWYAAFHDEGHHPHVHMLCYSKSPSQGFLTVDGIRGIKSELVGDIFRHDLSEIYRQQTLYRSEVAVAAEDALHKLSSEMAGGVLHNDTVTQLMADLAGRLRFHSGKMVYGYLRPPVKSIVDSVVDELEKDPRVAEAYAKWCEARQEVVHSYQNAPEPIKLLSQHKEFKQIRNMVVKEAACLMRGDFTIEHAAREVDEELAASTTAEQIEPQHGDGAADLDAGDAVSRLRSSAEQGDHQAAYQLGRLLLAGELTQKDATEGLRWMLASAEAGNQHAQYALGKFYLFGDDELRDEEAAVHWLTHAAQQGNIYAAYLLEQREQWPLGVAIMAGTRLLGGIGQIFASTPPIPKSSPLRIELDRKRRRELMIKHGGKGIQQAEEIPDHDMVRP